MKIFKNIFATLIILSAGNSAVICQETDSIDNQTNYRFGEFVWPAKWYNDKKSAFSFTFDDGFASHFENARPILNQYEFKGTFYVIPLFLADSLPGIWRYGTWTMFQAMSLEGHEVGSHSLNHLHLLDLEIGDTITEGTILYELYRSHHLIQQRIPSQKCITFAYPFAEHNALIDSLTSLFYESARADGDSTNHHTLTKEQYYTLSSVEVRFSEPRNSPQDDLDELQFIKDWIDSLILKEDWGILLGHEVVPFDSISGLWHPYSINWFINLCEWTKNKSNTNDVWIETVANITRYLKEKTHFSYEILTYNESQIKLTITDDLDDEIFNHPLTIYIKVPVNWESVLLIQGQTIDTLAVVNNDSGSVVMANVIPGGYEITLYKMIIDGVDNLEANNNSFYLYQNYPNPFNPYTKIRYEITDRQYVRLMVYDILGNEIATLVDAEKPPGVYEVDFSVQGGNYYDANEKTLASGVYIYSLRINENIVNRKMIVTK